MEEIINETEDYQGQTLYDFRLIFNSINKKQRHWLVSHFQDYAWGGGLCIAQCFATEMPKTSILKSFSSTDADVEFKFTSSKQFLYKNETDWTEEDLDEILDSRLIGKDQFLANIYFGDVGLVGKKITFIDQNGFPYDVELSKYPAINRVEKSI